MRLIPPAVLSLALAAGLLAGPGGPAQAGPTPPGAAPESQRAPALRVTRIARGLDHPWDVRSIGQGRLLVTERDRASLTLVRRGRTRDVKFPSSRVWVSGETGLMGLEVDPDFADNRRIYTCQGGTTAGGGHDVRIMRWTLDKKATSVSGGVKLLGGLPATSGRHGGCRLLIDSAGSLLVGTGDAAVGSNPEDLTSLGGKTLRLDRTTGKPWPTNPFVDAANRRQRYVHTFGHRNVQGLAERADGSLWSIEQGTDRDDEVNTLFAGGDYGYNPVPGYNEAVPMTDQGLPGPQIDADWSSGNPTVATSGGTFVSGAGWGSLSGSLAVAALKASKVLFLSFTAEGILTRVQTPGVLRRYGRIRQIVRAPGGALWVTTDNGGGSDVVLKVRPR